MKTNRIKRSHKWQIVAISTIVGLAAVTLGLITGYDYLRGIWLEQCIIRDMESQVTIETGKMVHPGNIAEALDLKPGANLATIDFDARRRQLLADIPNLRAVRITRRLPTRIHVVAEERAPIAKIGICGQRSITGLVTDSEGVVFAWQRGTQMLPTIYEPRHRRTTKGKKLDDRSRAALCIIETCRDPTFAELNIQDIDTSAPDYLKVTLGSYSIAKIAWDGMDDFTRSSKAELENRLRRLVQAIRTHVASGTKTWNATMPDMIFADTQERQ